MQKQCCQPSVKNTDTSIISASEKGGSVFHNLSVKIAKTSIVSDERENYLYILKDTMKML